MFSNAVKLSDLNDFLLPSQECVLPLLASSKKASAAQKEATSSAAEAVNTNATNGKDLIKPNLIKLKPKRRSKYSREVVAITNESSAFGASSTSSALLNPSTSDKDAISAPARSNFYEEHDGVIQPPRTVTTSNRENGAASPLMDNLSNSWKPSDPFITLKSYHEAGSQASAAVAADTRGTPPLLTTAMEPSSFLKQAAVTEAHSFTEDVFSKKIETKQVAFAGQKDDPVDPMVAQVSLYDCLACSGCVTTAETVLLQQHSIKEFLKNLKSKPISVVSISPQSRTALCKFFNLTADSVMRKLAFFFKGIGANYVLDTTVSEALCLLETQHEFISRFRADFGESGEQAHIRKEGLLNTASMSNEVSTDPSFASSTAYLSEQVTNEKACEHPSNRWPILTSHCPGWICYAEKVLEESVIPHISTVRSSQQIQGLLVKSLLRESHNGAAFLRYYRSLWNRTPLLYPLNLLKLKSNSDGTLSKDCTIHQILSKYNRWPCYHNTLVKVSDIFGDATTSGARIHDIFNAQETGDASVSPYSRKVDLVGSAPTDTNRIIPFQYITASDIFHTCIMPCYDKKIESARTEFLHSADADTNHPPTGDIPDVDTVLATSELLDLFKLFEVSFSNLPEMELDNLMTMSARALFLPTSADKALDPPFPLDPRATVCSSANAPNLSRIPQNSDEKGAHTPSKGAFNAAHSLASPLQRVSQYNGGSGGFVDAVFRFAAKELYGMEIEGPLPYKVGKNKDYKEVTLEVGGHVVLRFVIAYGFRNVQNLMRRLNIRSKQTENTRAATQFSLKNTSQLTKNLASIHYVELMACPGGCLNGSGQLLEQLSKEGPQELNRERLVEDAVTKSADRITSSTIQHTDASKGILESQGVAGGAAIEGYSASGNSEKVEGAFGNATTEDWVSKGLSKLEAQKKSLDNLENRFHSDEELPFVSPENFPHILKVYRYLKQREGSLDPMNENVVPYGTIRSIQTEHKSLKGSPLADGSANAIFNSALKW